MRWSRSARRTASVSRRASSAGGARPPRPSGGQARRLDHRPGSRAEGPTSSRRGGSARRSTGRCGRRCRSWSRRPGSGSAAEEVQRCRPGLGRGFVVYRRWAARRHCGERRRPPSVPARRTVRRARRRAKSAQRNAGLADGAAGRGFERRSMHRSVCDRVREIRSSIDLAPRDRRGLASAQRLSSRSHGARRPPRRAVRRRGHGGDPEMAALIC